MLLSHPAPSRLHPGCRRMHAVPKPPAWWALRPAQGSWIRPHIEPLAGGYSAVLFQLHFPAWKGLHCKHICSLVMHPMGAEGWLMG